MIEKPVLGALALVLTALLLGRCAGSGGTSEMKKFPWPPPKASAFAVIDRGQLERSGGALKLGDVARRLESACDFAGYGERSYYSVPNGFALVTRIEQINEDGTPMEGPTRWSVAYSPAHIDDFFSYIKALLRPNIGHFRVTAFIVTDTPFSMADSTFAAAEATALAGGGMLTLPESVARMAFTPAHRCIALIYEYEQRSAQVDPAPKNPSGLQGITHLERSRLWEGIVQ